MTRRRISARERAAIFTSNGGVCHLCRSKIDGGREQWDIEHVIPLKMGGDDEGANLQPAHSKCHRAKTAEDAGHIAKSKRMHQRDIGIKREPNHPMPGSRKSRWKKKLSGEVVKR